MIIVNRGKEKKKKKKKKKKRVFYSDQTEQVTAGRH